MFYWIKTNRFIKKIVSNYVWDIPNADHKIYLTFDDGPIPEITEWVLQALEKYNAKATFFCIGDNIRKYPKIFEKVIAGGHSIGNHTFNHLNGWKTSCDDYLENSFLFEEQALQSKIYNQKSKIFRPPYGKIKISQAKKLRQQGYKIIMWDILSADYDCNISQEKCLENVVKNIAPGSIIVFHDSLKAFPRLKFALPKALEILNKRGYLFEAIQ